MSKNKEQQHQSFDLNLFQFLADNISDEIWVIDAESMKFTYISPGLIKKRGFTLEEIVSKKAFDSICPEYVDVVSDQIKKRIESFDENKTDEPSIFEFEQPCKDGSTIWVETVSRLRKNPETRKLEIFGTTRDISDRKKIENDLHKSEIKYRSILEAQPDLMFVLDSRGNHIDFYAQKSNELFAKTNDIIGKNVLDLLPNEEANLYTEKINECLKTKTLQSFNYQLEFEHGSRIFNCRMVCSDDDQVLAIVSNITDEQKNLNELKLISDAIENSINGFDIVDENLKFRYVNKAYVKMWGYDSAEEIIGSTPIDHCEDPGTPEFIINSLKENGECRVEFKAKRKDGSLFDVLMYARLDFDEFGKEIYPTTSIDISEQKKTLKLLQDNEKQLSTIYNSSNEFMTLLKVENRKFIIESCNNAYIEGCQYFGIDITKKDLIGHNLEDFLRDKAKMPEQQIKETFKRYREVVKSKKILIFDENVIINEQRLSTETVLSPILNEKGECVNILYASRNITEREKAKDELAYREESIRRIISQASGKTGKDFFDAMALVMEDVTKATFSFIGEIQPNNSVKTISVAHQNSIMDNIVYDLKGTPCENVVEHSACVYPGKVQELFPEDYLLVEMGINAYAGAPIRDQKGNAIGIIVSLYSEPFKDSHITETIFDIFSVRIGVEMERSIIEQALVESETRYKMLSNLSKEGIVIHQNGKLINLNKAFCELFGYEEHELKAHENLLPILLTPASQKLAQTKIKDQFEGVYIVEGICKDGKHIFIETDGKNLVYNGLDVRVATFRDITARLQAEEQAFKLSKAVEQSPESIIITDKEGKIEYVNPRFEKLTGYTFNEVVGKTTDMLQSGEHSDDFYQTMWKTIESGKIWQGEFHNKKKNGELYWENASISALMNDQGEITHYVAVKEDITEKKQILFDLQIAKEKAEESDRLKSAFLASMSHEIRTPLNTIIGFSNIIADSNEDPELNKFSDLINKQNDILLQLVDDIIEFARVESGSIDLNEHQFCLGTLINNVYLKFKNKCPQTVKLETEIVHPEFYITSDEHRIQQIFSNLLSNAIKFTPQGSIRFGFKFNENNEVICFVKDTGVGIPKDQQENIFRRFTKLDTFTQGTGLGLAIIHHLVSLMDGEVWLKSEPGKGSDFYFRVPFKLKNIPPMPTERDEKIDKPSNKQNVVLIVEDDESNYLYLKELMNAINAESVHVIDGEGAIEACKEKDFDLILMDLKLPGLDGYQASTEIKKLNPKIPIIAQTAYALAGDDLKAKKAGCDEYISKPIQKNKLFDLIKKYI